MAGLDAPFSSFSGLFVFVALVAAMNRWLTLAGLLLTVAGAAGVGIFWERWSTLAGENVRLAALLHPVWPTRGQAELLASHAAMLIIGVAVLAAVDRRKHPRTRRASA